jgi:hypothetical protein
MLPSVRAKTQLKIYQPVHLEEWRQMANSLVYFVSRGVLKGNVGSHLINMPAVSGAGRGRKNKPAFQMDPFNQAKAPLSRNTLTQKTKHIRGGPIPVGFYVETLCADLVAAGMIDRPRLQ